MNKISLLTGLIALSLGLTGCGGASTLSSSTGQNTQTTNNQTTEQPQKPAEPVFQKWTVEQALEQFKKAGLEAENVRDMEKEDYGLAPMNAQVAKRFFIPSLGKDNGGRIYSFESQEELENMKAYYESFRKKSAAFHTWVYTKDNILVQINGDLKEKKAKKYEAALKQLK